MLADQPDWSVFRTEGIYELARRVARRVHVEQHPTLELDDLEQEGLIILASNAEEVGRLLEQGGMGLVNVWLRQRVIQKTATELARQRRQVPFTTTRGFD